MRAKLLSTKDAKPILRAPIQLPGYDRELFFDIEVDPMRDICYLHGFVERQGRDNATEKFVAFFADECTPAAERAAFAAAWAYMRASRPCAIYYYSKYERTIYRKLQQKYPDVCSAEEIEELFDPAHAIDLYYDVVQEGDRVADMGFLDQDAGEISRLLMARHAPVRRRLDRMV